MLLLIYLYKVLLCARSNLISIDINKKLSNINLNNKTTGILYLIIIITFGIISNILYIKLLIRLSYPGIEYISNNKLCNSIIISYTIVMIFFLLISLSIINKYLGNINYYFYDILFNIKNIYNLRFIQGPWLSKVPF